MSVAQELHARLPHSELLLVEGAGHMLHEDADSGVAERIAAFVAVPRGCGVVGVVVRDVVKIGLDVPGGIAV